MGNDENLQVIEFYNKSYKTSLRYANPQSGSPSDPSNPNMLIFMPFVTVPEVEIYTIRITYWGYISCTTLQGTLCTYL
jgi:hypothetical protein